MIHPRSRTVALVRLLHAVGGVKRRRGRLPRQRQPDLIRKEYLGAILPHVRAATSDIARHVQPEVLRLLADQRRAEGKQDADRDAHARDLIERAGRRAAEALSPTALHAVATQFGKRTSDFQRGELDKQVRQAIGVSFASVEKPTRDLVPVFAKANVELIKTVPDRYWDRMAKDVREAFETGMHPETLAQRFVDLDDMAEGDARRIARDQIGKLNANFNQERQESLGVTGYFWRGAKDARERDNHAELEGELCQWDDPPMGGGTDEDEEGHPGEGIQCFPSDARVRLFDARVKRAYRRRFVGPLVMLSTASGKELLATANHPVLSDRGWLAAHLLKVGDYVFEAGAQGRQFAIDDPQSSDSSIEQVFRALAQLGITHRVAAEYGWLHGDVVIDQEIDVVDVDRSLWLERDLACSQRFCEQILTRAYASATPLRKEYLGLLGPYRSAHSVVGGACQLLALIGGHRGMTGQHSRAPITRLDALAQQLTADGCAADVELFRETLHALPSDVELTHHLARIVLGVWRRAVNTPASLHAPSAEQLGQSVSLVEAHSESCSSLSNSHSLFQQPSRIVEKRIRESYEGHVFNLETSSGWYVTQNLIVRNCRCFAEPDLQEIVQGVAVD